MHDHDPPCVKIELCINGRIDFYVHLAPELARVVGIRVMPGNPFHHDHPGENPMPKCKVSLAKKSTQKMKMAASGMKAAGTDFVLLDNEDSSCTVQGVDVSGNTVDIASVATITAVSSDPTTLSADAPEGMKFTVHGLKPGSATVAVVATWNDGSIGPFSFDLPVSCAGTAATGITVTFGTPTVRP